MDKEDLKRQILYHQHLTNKTDHISVCRDLNGVQAQVLSNAFWAVKIRCSEDISPENWGAGLVKNWTVRGTMHVFAKDDLPLYLHEDRANYRRPVDLLMEDEFISLERKKYFADRIIEWIGLGCETREALKEKCFAGGMTAREAESIFNAWGGTIRYLAESGIIRYKVQEKKAFQLCESFVPMDAETAGCEILRRYFKNYGPASVKDAAYYLGVPQKEIKRRMKMLPLSCCNVDGIDYFGIIDEMAPELNAVGRRSHEKGAIPTVQVPKIPECLFLAGFDPLMLGYEKKTSLFLRQEYIRQIFSLSGIVMPSVLLHGNVAGRWKLQKKKLTVQMFEKVSEKDRRVVMEMAGRLFPEVPCDLED